jgi:hypothetical protein
MIGVVQSGANGEPRDTPHRSIWSSLFDIRRPASAAPRVSGELVRG